MYMLSCSTTLGIFFSILLHQNVKGYLENVASVTSKPVSTTQSTKAVEVSNEDDPFEPTIKENNDDVLPVTNSLILTSSIPAVRKVPNRELGLYIGVFLTVAGGFGLGCLIFFVVRRSRRRLYRQPSRNPRLRTDSADHFANPIQFPTGTYGNAVI